jgi:hypothetical protein
VHVGFLEDGDQVTLFPLHVVSDLSLDETFGYLREMDVLLLAANQLSLGFDSPRNNGICQFPPGPVGVGILRFGLGCKCLSRLVPRVTLGRLQLAFPDETLTKRVNPGVGVLDVLESEVGSVDAWSVAVVVESISE